MKIKLHLSIFLALCLMTAVPETVKASEPLDVEIPFSGIGKFEIRSAEGEKSSDPDTVTANGKGTFHVVVTEPGNYVYNLSESRKEPSFQIQLYVTSDPEGKLTSSLSITELSSGKKVDEIRFPEPVSPSGNKAAATPSARHPSSVKTGDTTPILPVACAAAGSLVLLTVMLKKKHHSAKGDCL